MTISFIVQALTAEFRAAVVAASNAGELGHGGAEEAAFTAQASVNRIAYRLDIVDEVERAIAKDLDLPGFVLSREPEELGL